MDAFRGSLASYRLSLLMPALMEEPDLSGTLKLERGALRREFVFKESCLVSECSNDPREHLAQVLHDLRILDMPRAAAAYEAAEAAGVALGTFLVERDFLERSRLIEALEHKAREALFDCYGWESGEIEFVPWKVERVRGVELKLKLGPLHRDALARSREWRAFRDVFPSPDTTFQVFREYAVDWGSEEDEAMIALAEHGAALSELLASAREGGLSAARRLLHLYRRGALSPKPLDGNRVGAPAGVEELLALARSYLHTRDFHLATAIAAQALERAPIPEAQALYREAEVHLALAVSDEILGLEGRLTFEPLPQPTPGNLTADDLYLYSKLKSSRSVRVALRSAAMGELAAYRSVERLMNVGVVRTQLGPDLPRRKTDPFGMRPLDA